MKTWGIDPGLNGAIALLDSNGQSLHLFDMPTLAIKKEKREIAPILIADILLIEPNTRVYVERVAARPGQGVTSMFNFGKGFGMILVVPREAGDHEIECCPIDVFVPIGGLHQSPLLPEGVVQGLVVHFPFG